MANARLLPLFVVLLLVPNCLADCYFHNPRGSNNRLNEKSANRRNANRCFDSQVSLHLTIFKKSMTCSLLLIYTHDISTVWIDFLFSVTCYQYKMMHQIDE